MRPLDGQVVIVTGAGRGLGRAYALDLARRGAAVVVNTRPRDPAAEGSAERVVAEIEAAGGRAVAVALAVEEPEAGERLLAGALDAFGRLDGLVNNAGIAEARTLHKQTPEEFRRVFEVNFFGAVLPTWPIYRHLREQGSGRILMSTSAAGLHGVHGMAAYSSSKAALIGLMRVIALEGASHGVHCNAIAPYAATGMTGEYVDAAMAKTLSPDRVAPVVSWLMSPDCPLNGRTLVAGAGMVRPAERVESDGLELSPDDAFGQLAALAEPLMRQDGWRTFDNGNLAFDDLMASRSRDSDLR